LSLRPSVGLGELGRKGLNRAAFRRPQKALLGVMSEAAAPLLRAGAAAVTRGNVGPPSSWRRGLILGHNHLGDVLYRTCSLPHLRRGLPECEWSYLTSAGSAAVLERNPYLAEVLPWTTGEDSWTLEPGALDRLRERRFDSVLCTNTLRHYPDFFLAARLGIPNRVGFVHKGLSGLITHPAPIDYPSPYPAYFRSMVSFLTGAPPSWSMRPEMHPDAEARSEGLSARRRFVGDKPIVACVLTSRQPRGSWPAEWMVAALRQASKLIDFNIALCGGPADGLRLSTLAQELDSTAEVFAGELSVMGLAAFFSHCAALFTLDSGPRHIGNAVGIPVIFARNMAQLRIETGTYCDTETDIAPVGDYLSDAAISRMAAMQPVQPVANLLARVIRISVNSA